MARDTTVCSPGVAPFHSYVNSFHEYGVFSFHIVADRHGPPSTLTSTAFRGVPSVSANPTAFNLFPFRVSRAIADFSLMRLTHVSNQMVSPPTVWLFSVT